MGFAFSGLLLAAPSLGESPPRRPAGLKMQNTIGSARFAAQSGHNFQATSRHVGPSGYQLQVGMCVFRASFYNAVARRAASSLRGPEIRKTPLGSARFAAQSGHPFRATLLHVGSSRGQMPMEIRVFRSHLSKLSVHMLSGPKTAKRH